MIEIAREIDADEDADPWDPRAFADLCQHTIGSPQPLIDLYRHYLRWANPDAKPSEISYAVTKSSKQPTYIMSKLAGSSYAAFAKILTSRYKIAPRAEVGLRIHADITPQFRARLYPPEEPPKRSRHRP